MQYECPSCQDSLMQCDTDAGSKRCHCGQCHRDWRYQACCQDCAQPLELLRACGAVQYFCNTCRKQVSKSALSWQPLIDR